jgi:phosphoribosylamine--glycine ligase
MGFFKGFFGRRKMKILVIGGGGREHALVWKLASSPRVKKIYCAPGNAGIAKMATCVPIKADDIEGLLDLTKKEKIDMTVVGPEAPLTLGIVDVFKRSGMKIFGPTREAAVLEGSKVFAKDFCNRHGIPTAASATFTDIKEARTYLLKQQMPVVIKADGLAAGKGVMICKDMTEASKALEEIMVEKAFGDAGNKVVIEEFLHGEEASFIAISDGKSVLPLATSQDHKRVFDDDKGPNTGGMGAYSPAPVVTAEVYDRVMKKIMVPAVNGMAKDGRAFVGVLYAGLMIRNGEPKVLEFNCRFGDPETQPIMMRLKTDLVDVMEAAVNGTLNKIELEWDSRPAVCIVLAAQGYPGSYEKGSLIHGLDDADGLTDTAVFHAGTTVTEGGVVTSGGRVLGVTALGGDIASAIKNAYAAAGKISWEGMYYRKDIGKRALVNRGS